MLRRQTLVVAIAAMCALNVATASAQSGQIVGLANKCVDMFQAGTEAGTPVVLWECTGNSNQQWRFESQAFGGPNNSYKIVGLNGLCLVPGSVGNSGLVESVLGSCDTAEAVWTTEGLGGSSQLVHAESNDCLDVFGMNTDNGTPLVLFQCVDQLNQQWRLLSDGLLPAYFVPYLEVNRNSASGITTLFAVRNPSDEAVSVRYEYFAAGDSLGDPEQVQTAVLEAGAVRTVDVRSVGGFSSSSGWVGITAVDGATGQPLAAQDLYGDYFRFDPGNNFASGDKLLAGEESLCKEWHIRFFNGGAFNGGTRFRFFVPGLANGDIWSATGRVLTESGDLVQTLVISSSNRATSQSSFVLNAAFGAVEWTFQGGVRGHVAAVMDALGAFSVGLEAECRD